MSGEQTTENAEVAEALAPMLADGFDHHEHDVLKPGVRVRNRGEQYDTARQFGTGAIVAVMRKPGSWEQAYGRLNIEVLVRRDKPLIEGGSVLTWWADYGTYIAEGCWLCDGIGCDRCMSTPPGQPDGEAAT